MIITISGIAGSGKSTVAKLLAKRLNLKHYSTGDFMREIAEKKGISLLELSKLAEKDQSTDIELDERQKNLGKTQDNFVIDARLGFHFIPNSIKVFLEVDLNEAAKRIFDEKRQHEQYKDIQESIEKIKTRIKSEEWRYKEYYNLNYQDKKHYDIMIDTTDITPQEVVNRITGFVNSSPKHL